jgi:hypothetical protein
LPDKEIGMTKLPVWATVTEAYRALWRHRSLLLRSAWVPLLLYVAVSLGAPHLEWFIDRLRGFPPEAFAELQNYHLPWRWYLIELASRLIGSGFAALLLVHCLRLFILGPRDGLAPWPLPFSRSALALLGFLWPYPFTRALLSLFGLVILYVAIKIALFRTLSSFVSILEPGPQSVAVLLAVTDLVGRLLLFYLLARLGFAAVLAALRFDWSLKTVWKLTANHAPRLMLALFLVQVPVTLAREGLSLLILSHWASALLWSTVWGVFWILSVAVWAAVSAVAFAVITGHPAKGLKLPGAPAAAAS